MDFGFILDKWERGRSEKNRARGSGDLEKWLNENEIHDKDAGVEKAAVPGEERRRLLNARPDDILDIHGLNSDKAWSALENFFSNAKNRGRKKLRIIHGKGNHSQGEAVLGRIVRAYIEQCSFAGESGHEKTVNGGAGATWVLLKG